MKPVLHSLAALCLAHACLLFPAHAQETGADKTEAALASVTQLARINGVALACQDMPVASRAKKLMLAHAPKTQRFGSAFEEATHGSYLTQTSGSAACPDSAALSAQLDTVAVQLQRTLPINTAPAQ